MNIELARWVRSQDLQRHKNDDITNTVNAVYVMYSHTILYFSLYEQMFENKMKYNNCTCFMFVLYLRHRVLSDIEILI